MSSNHGHWPPVSGGGNNLVTLRSDSRSMESNLELKKPSDLRPPIYQSSGTPPDKRINLAPGIPLYDIIKDKLSSSVTSYPQAVAIATSSPPASSSLNVSDGHPSSLEIKLVRFKVQNFSNLSSLRSFTQFVIQPNFYLIKLEEFLKDQIGIKLPLRTHYDIKLETSEGVIVPLDWSVLKSDDNYILKVYNSLSPSPNSLNPLPQVVVDSHFITSSSSPSQLSVSSSTPVSDVSSSVPVIKRPVGRPKRQRIEKPEPSNPEAVGDGTSSTSQQSIVKRQCILSSQMKVSPSSQSDPPKRRRGRPPLSAKTPPKVPKVAKATRNPKVKEPREPSASSDSSSHFSRQSPLHSHRSDSSLIGSTSDDDTEISENSAKQSPKKRRIRKRLSSSSETGKDKTSIDLAAKNKKLSMNGVRSVSSKSSGNNTRWIVPSQHIKQEFLEDQVIKSEHVSQILHKETDKSGTAHDLMTIYSRMSWLSLGKDHPEPLAESESLASVMLPSVLSSLELRLPCEVADLGLLSNPQLSCSIFASRTFNQHLANGKVHGYFLGDGTGCGKGRIIASCIWHLWNLGYRRHVWLSVGSDLVQDTMRDLRDIGAGHIPVVDLGSLRLVDLDTKSGMNEATQRASKLNPMWHWNGEGVLFSTYSLLSRSVNQKNREDILKDVQTSHVDVVELMNDEDVVAPSSVCASMSVKSRLGQILKWMSRLPTKKVDRLAHPRLLNYLRRHPKESWKLPYWSYCPSEIKRGGLLCFDEAHKAKNLVATPEESRYTTLKGTSTGLTVQRLQDVLSHCPVLYASATGATELKNMAYMTRLGLWGPGANFSDFTQFKESVDRGGVAAMECLAMDLKSAGLYSCRTLSFSSVVFHSHIVRSSDAFVQTYDAIASLMMDIYKKIVTISEESNSRLADPTNGSRTTGVYIKSRFWGTQQRVFKQLLVSQKVEKAVYLVKEAVHKGSQVVISLWGTGEARTSEKIRELKNQKMYQNKKKCEDEEDVIELDDFLSPPKLMLEKLLKEELSSPELGVPTEELDILIAKLESIEFPNNPLDDLIDRLGGPCKVAELSGRSKRLTWDKSGRLRYVCRDIGLSDEKGLQKLIDRGLASVNLKEQELFQTGRKKIAVITEAASAGISLHSDDQRINPAPREMICIELPWAADKAVQQFGRIHRSNQKHSPTYHLLVSDVGGERRFVACIAKRMKTLGAITRGDRRVAFGGGKGDTPYEKEEKVDRKIEESKTELEGMPLLDFDIYSKWGTQARVLLSKWLSYYSQMYSSLGDKPEVMPPMCVKGPHTLHSSDVVYESNTEFAVYMLSLLRACGVIEGTELNPNNKKEDKSKGKEMDRFLNRLLMIPLEPQNQLFRFFNQLHDELIDAAKINGEYDKGVENLNMTLGVPHKLSILSREVLWLHPSSGAQTILFKISMDRGISWDQAQFLLKQRQTNEAQSEHEGFYWLPHQTSHQKFVALVLQRRQSFANSQRYLIYKPHVGVSALIGGATHATIDSILNCKWIKAGDDELDLVKKYWLHQFDLSESNCIHKQVWGQCKHMTTCRAGKRLLEEYLLSGNIITLWSRLEKWFSSTNPTGDEDELNENKKPTTEVAGVQTKKVLRLIRANIEDGPQLVGAKLPHDKVSMIRRNLKAFSPIVSQSEQHEEHQAIRSVYQTDFFLKLVQFLSVIISKTESENALSSDDIWSLLVESLDEEKECESKVWSQMEIQTLHKAFPPLAHGVDNLDRFIRICSQGQLFTKINSSQWMCHSRAIEDFIKRNRLYGSPVEVAIQEYLEWVTRYYQNFNSTNHPKIQLFPADHQQLGGSTSFLTTTNRMTHQHSTKSKSKQKGKNDFIPLSGPWTALPLPSSTNVSKPHSKVVMISKANTILPASDDQIINLADDNSTLHHGTMSPDDRLLPEEVYISSDHENKDSTDDIEASNFLSFFSSHQQQPAKLDSSQHHSLLLHQSHHLLQQEKREIDSHWNQHSESMLQNDLPNMDILDIDSKLIQDVLLDVLAKHPTDQGTSDLQLKKFLSPIVSLESDEEVSLVET